LPLLNNDPDQYVDTTAVILGWGAGGYKRTSAELLFIKEMVFSMFSSRRNRTR
jgi:hypothetical protein